MRVLVAVLDGVLIVLLLFGTPFAWLLRDGLGPDSVDSSGWTAVYRTFTTLYFGPAVLVVLAADVALRLVARGR